MVKWTEYYGQFAKSARGKYKGRWADISIGRTIMPRGFDPRQYFRDEAKRIRKKLKEGK